MFRGFPAQKRPHVCKLPFLVLLLLIKLYWSCTTDRKLTTNLRQIPPTNRIVEFELQRRAHKFRWCCWYSNVVITCIRVRIRLRVWLVNNVLCSRFCRYARSTSSCRLLLNLYCFWCYTAVREGIMTDTATENYNTSCDDASNNVDIHSNRSTMIVSKEMSLRGRFRRVNNRRHARMYWEFTDIQRGQKVGHRLMAIILPNLNRFKTIFWVEYLLINLQLKGY